MSLVGLATTLDSDRKILYVGIRPGERLHEALIVPEEAMHTSLLDDTHFIIDPPTVTPSNSLPFQYEYTSDNPVHILSVNEMKILLASYGAD